MHLSHLFFSDCLQPLDICDIIPALKWPWNCIHLLLTFLKRLNTSSHLLTKYSWYPTDVDKQNLAKQTGLTRNQVSNWFIKARVRLWKLMVEDIYSLEMRQKNKMSAVTEEQPQPPSSCMTNPADAQSFRGGQDNRCSSSRGIQGNNLAPMPNHIHESVLNFVGHDVSTHDNVGVGIGAGNGLANGVSLTLGLHQNNGVCFTEPIPLTVPRRFGLDECTETYMASAFGAEQERQLVKDVGGRLLHDFVGTKLDIS